MKFFVCFLLTRRHSQRHFNSFVSLAREWSGKSCNDAHWLAAGERFEMCNHIAAADSWMIYDPWRICVWFLSSIIKSEKIAWIFSFLHCKTPFFTAIMNSQLNLLLFLCCFVFASEKNSFVTRSLTKAIEAFLETREKDVMKKKHSNNRAFWNRKENIENWNFSWWKLVSSLLFWIIWWILTAPWSRALVIINPSNNHRNIFTLHLAISHKLLR